MNAIDLGLSVNWSDCNIGAKYIRDCGNYYAWSEFESKDNYNIVNVVGMSYEKLENNGIIENNKLSLNYDVAYKLLGENWRMPTREESLELLNNVDTVYDSLTTIKLVSKINGNSIIIPLTGFKHLKDKFFNTVGYYWTSTPSNNSFSSSAIHFDLHGNHRLDYNYRSYGLTIRPVCIKQ